MPWLFESSPAVKKNANLNAKDSAEGVGGGGHDVERVQVMIREKQIFITLPPRNNNSRELLIVIYAADNPFYSHCTDVSCIKSKE